MSLTYISRYTASVGEEDRLIEFLQKIGDASKEAGCQEFRIFHCEDVQEVVVAVERWESKTAH